MNALPHLCAAHPAAWLLTCCTALGAQAADEKTIDDFLVNVDPSPLNAAQLIGMSPSAIVPIHEPKDFVLALGGGTSSSVKDSFALSITPARSSLPGLRMAIGDYAPEGKDKKYLARLWGGTTFTYAQNRANHADTEYRQQAIAVQSLLYLEPSTDPVVAAYTALSAPACRYPESGLSLKSFIEAKQNKIRADKGREPTPEEMNAILAEAQGDEGLKAHQAQKAQLEKECINTAVSTARQEWNASRLGFSMGQAWIHPMSGAGGRQTLTRRLTLSGAYGVGDFGLLNATVQRVQRDLDLSSLGGVPAYKSSNLVAARYTHAGGARKDLYAIAEVSNARGSDNTSTSRAFKYALGLDKKFGENVWLEFRLGRSRRLDGTGEETVSLLNLTLSPGSGLSQGR